MTAAFVRSAATVLARSGSPERWLARLLSGCAAVLAWSALLLYGLLASIGVPAAARLSFVSGHLVPFAGSVAAEPLSQVSLLVLGLSVLTVAGGEAVLEVITI